MLINNRRLGLRYVFWKRTLDIGPSGFFFYKQSFSLYSILGFSHLLLLVVRIMIWYFAVISCIRTIALQSIGFGVMVMLLIPSNRFTCRNQSVVPLQPSFKDKTAQNKPLESCIMLIQSFNEHVTRERTAFSKAYFLGFLPLFLDSGITRSHLELTYCLTLRTLLSS